MKCFRIASVLVLMVCAVLFVPSAFAQANPEPAGWYAGDMHVHRSCGDSPESVSSMFDRMSTQRLSSMSLLADMGNGEVQNPATDLPQIDGQDDPVSTSGQILHWDAEWHWDATYNQYAHQALGGHLVALGVSNGHQIWNESTYPILDWAHEQDGIAGFAHMQYLDRGFPTSLSCCTPVEYPVEVALGAADFISEDVDHVNSGAGMQPENFIQSYYRLLNSGFRPGFAAGTDYPCNDGTVGSLLTYVQVAGGQMTYRNWIDGIAKGRTVLSRNGHSEFLNLVVNGTAMPGDEVALANAGNVSVTVTWTATQNLSGTIELVQNGTVVASKQTSASQTTPGSLTATLNFPTSGWLVARRMGNNEHYVHTAAVFVIVNNAPIRASASDAQFFVDWMDNLLVNTSPGGDWNSYYPTGLAAEQARYQAAKSLFQQIQSEALGSAPTLTSITVAPANQTIAPGSQLSFIATGNYSNGTSLNITAQARWSSSNTLVANVSTRGLAAAGGTGTTTITASLNGRAGSAILNVSTNPLTITTTTLASGVAGTAYSATLAASGGTQPYTWTIVSSTLPTGLVLNSSSGVISGTPTTAGTFNFTAQVADSGSPQQVVTNSLSIVISSSGGGGCPCTIWPSTSVPTTADAGPDSPVEVGVKFRADSNGYITGLRFYKASGNTGTHVGNLWNSAGTRLATVTFGGETTSGWQQAIFSSPVAINANTTYVASYFAPNGHYADDTSYFSTAVDRAPLHALADGTDGYNGVYRYGTTSSFPNSGWQSSNYWVDVVYTTSGGSDTTPPTITTTTPMSGAIGVGVTTSVTATFSEAINPATINTNTFQVRDPSNALAVATVTYNSTTQTATLLPSASLTTLATYTASVQGGSSGVKDVAGNALASTFTWSFMTAPAPGACPCSIWPLFTVPGEVDSRDSGPIELGMKFRSDVDGHVNGIRFYKSVENTGTHIGNLWSTNGTLLASATFTQESANGWQQVTFNPAVAINANTTYVASYFAPNGHYSDNRSYFGIGMDNAPLHALRDGVDGGNGVFNYGSTSTFPSSTYQSANYWVDVVFTPTDVTAPPTVISVSPASGTTGASLGTVASASFSQPMTASTITASTFVLADSSGQQIPGNVSYTPATATATFTPTLELSASTVYTLTIMGGSNGVKDYNGNAMTSDFAWSFTTGPVPPSSGPGGPILVISSLLNPFSEYYSEILNAEGLNEYTLADIAGVNTSLLSNYDVAILGEMSLTPSQVSMLTNWVNGGGRLIAMRPDKHLASLLGLTPDSSTLADAYLKVQTSSGPGVGIVNQTIQFHGPADLYTLNGASSLATLYQTASQASPSPAVTLVGAGSGQAAAFSYDLARSVVYTRQGNPAWSGERRDGQDGPIRSDDLFYGPASFDPQPNWVDLSKIAIPQADEQQRLLANLILQMSAARKPLPRFWYFPNGHKAVVVLTGDDHGSYYGASATSRNFSDDLAASPTGCSVADWQCVRGTSYLFPQDLADNSLTDAQVAAYVAQGFEISVHVDSDPSCSDWNTAELDAVYTSLLSSLATQFPSLAAPQTHRMHCIGWSDFDSQPLVERRHGIRLDTSYYYWPPDWVNDQPGLFTGSGMPMRFTDRNGNLIDVYQATTQMTDESNQTYPDTIDALLDNALGSTGYYGAFVVNAHTDESSYPGIAPDIRDSAKSRGVPVVSALQMLTWLDGRNSSSFGSFSWSGNTLGFTILAGNGARNLQAMLPTSSTAGVLKTITRNGAVVSYSTQTIKGLQYAFFNAVAGPYLASYGPASVNVSSVSLNPTTILGGNPSTGTVTLTSAAPAGGVVVILSSNNATLAQAPQSVTVAASATSATFSITTSPVTADTTVAISAVYGTTRSANLIVASPPPTLTSITLNPTSVIGGNSSTGTVTLSAVAKSGGAVVSLTSNNLAAHVPSSVTVFAGNMTAAFTVTTTPVAATTSATISGTYGTTQSAGLTVNPPTLSSVTLNPTTVTGGTSSTGTVNLTGAAPSSGVVVTLASNNTVAARVPASVTVASGRTSATFTVTTSPVVTNTAVNISGTYGVSQGATLTVNAPTISALSLNPTSIVGGTNSTGTVTLTGAAPTGGMSVALGSGNPTVAQVPSAVTVAAGSTSATFAVTSIAVTADTTSVITGTLGVSRTATLTITPPASLSSVTLNPTSLIGGANSTGTLTLTRGAPSGGAVVTLQSNNTNAARVPASVTIAAGSSTATFTITTSPVAVNTAVTISGTYGVTRTTTLNVNAPTISGLTLNPTSIVGGNNSTGTVTITGAAPTGGISVSLGSSNPSVAQVPGSLTVPAGGTSATFVATTIAVTANTSSVITGTLGVSRTATLTITAPASLTSLTLNPSSLVGGNSSTATVNLTVAAPSGGAVVTLQSSNSTVAPVPASVTVPAGSTSANFTITTKAVAVNTSVTISGTYGVTRTNTLTVNAPTLSSVTRNPSSVVGGNGSTGTVNLTGVAPTGGVSVSLQSSNTSAATVPATVTVPAGSASATFPITTKGVGSTTTVTISAIYAGTTRTATLTISVASFTSLTLNPSTVTGGNSSIGTVTLNGAAPPGGASVSLRSSRTSAAQVPSSVTIPANATSATFTVTTSAVHGTSSSISGTYRLTTRSAILTIQ